MLLKVVHPITDIHDPFSHTHATDDDTYDIYPAPPPTRSYFSNTFRRVAEATAENTAESTPVHMLSEAVVELLRLQVTAITLVEASPDASPLSATLL